MCNIDFELRLDKDMTKHTEMAGIYSTLLSKYAEKSLESKCDRLTLYPVARLGMSNAKVFYLSVEYDDTSTKQIKIAKFDEVYKINIELEGAEVFKQAVEGPFETKNIDGDTFGLLVYDAIDHGIEFYESFDDKDLSLSHLTLKLDNLYNNIAIYHQQTNGNKDLLDDYEWYLDRTQKPLLRLENSLSYTESQIINKLINFHKNLDTDKKTIIQTSVHGDLHARNIMSDQNGSHLIDFYWAHQGHIAKDFTLLECTIIYMLLSKYMFKLKECYLESDELHKLVAQVYNNLELEDYNTCSEDTETDQVYKRAFECIKIIRKHVNGYLESGFSKDFKCGLHEYLHSLLLMSISMVVFKDVNQDVYLMTVDTMLNRLDELNEA